jgi:ureidoacrylate peracid hydrolase
MSDVVLDPRRTAVLAVDFQHDFCSPGGFFDRSGHDVGPCSAAAEHAAAAIDAARAAGATIVFTMTVRTEPPPHRLRPSRRPREREGAEPGTLGQEMYAPGAWGTSLVLEPAPGDVVIEKDRQSPFHRTSLEAELRGRGIDTVAVCGVTTNCCVDCTVRDAHVRDLDVVLLSDCVGAFAAERHLHDATLQNTERFFGLVMPADAFLAALAATISTGRRHGD